MRGDRPCQGVERAAILARGPVLDLEEWPLAAPQARIERSRSSPEALETAGQEAPSERRIEAAVAESRGRVSGPSGAAARLRIPPSTLEHSVRALHIDKSRFKFG
jgi:formate hydrogenlyase transcriptional activator